MKKGEIVQYVPYAMGRMPFLWGPDVMEIKPERWLRDGVFHSESPFKYTVFQVLDIVLPSCDLRQCCSQLGHFSCICKKLARTVLQTRFQLLPVAVGRLTNWTPEHSKIHDISVFSTLLQLIFVVAGGASYLLGPRFGFLTAKSNCSTPISFLYIPVGSWTRNHLHFHHGYADEKRCTSHNVPSAVSNGCLHCCNKITSIS